MTFNLKAYMESGDYQGFLPIALQHVKQHYNVQDVHILPWKLYTDKGIQLQHANRYIYPYLKTKYSQLLINLPNITQFVIHFILN